MSENQVTVIGLQEMCNQVLAKRAEVEAAEDVFKKLDKECTLMEEKLISTMTELGLKSFKESDKNFIVKETFQLATPKGEQKEIFFNYLKEVGHFDALATVHSRTLASWYNQENEAAIARGEPGAFIPGLELPTKRLGLTVRKV